MRVKGRVGVIARMMVMGPDVETIQGLGMIIQEVEMIIQEVIAVREALLQGGTKALRLLEWLAVWSGGSSARVGRRLGSFKKLVEPILRYFVCSARVDCSELTWFLR